jgi:HlyD family secretion protein
MLSVLATGVGAVAYLLLAPQPISVDLATIDRGKLEVTVDEEGETQVKEVYRISAPITGKLERLNIHVGDQVKAGQRVARVRPADPPIRDRRSRLELAAATKAAIAAVALAQAQVLQAEFDLKFAESDMNRAQILSRKGVVSARAREEAELQVSVKTAEQRKAEANLELRRRELESARMSELEPGQMQSQVAEDQCCVAITAPASGVVLKVLTESEQVVQSGTTILEIGDPHDLEIVVDLLSNDAVSISKNTYARIEDWGGDGILEARVRRIDPAGFTKVSALGIEEQRVNAVLDFTSPPDQWRNLGHAFKVTVRILKSDRQDVLRVPLGALFRLADDWAVYVARENTSNLASVKLGAFSLTHAEVLEGLIEGDQVVEFPSDRVADGVEIKQREGAR